MKTQKKKKNKENRLVVGNLAWADTIPEWILKEIESEWTINATLNCTGKKLKAWEQVGDAEVVAYLFPATMAHPVDHDYVDIYSYLSSKLMLKTKRATKETLQDDFKTALDKGLTDYQNSLLRELRCKIFRARGGKIKHPIFNAFLEVFKHSNKTKRDNKNKMRRSLLNFNKEENNFSTLAFESPYIKAINPVSATEELIFRYKQVITTERVPKGKNLVFRVITTTIYEDTSSWVDWHDFKTEKEAREHFERLTAILDLFHTKNGEHKVFDGRHSFWIIDAQDKLTGERGWF